MKKKEQRVPQCSKRYISKEVSYENGKHMLSYMFILLKGKSFEVEDTPFSRFFMSKDIINLSIETKKKTYARMIVPFLNYILIDSSEKIDTINDLTLELANKFVTDYASGIIDGSGERRAPNTIEKCELVLTKFIKWLCYPKDAGFKMKYIKRSIFEDTKSIFRVHKLQKEKRKRLEDLTPYLVKELISVALEHDPMLALGITLQAFVGMRVGDICQMVDHRFVWICTSWDFITDKYLLEELALATGPASTMSAYINLEQNYVLRSDGVRTSGIKTHRKQPIFEPFLPIIRNIYLKHVQMLKTKGINNKYNALFINEHGGAMTIQTYLQRFDKLCNKLFERMIELAPYNVLASEALRLLELAPLGTHSLRYFYTNQIGSYVPTPHMLAYYRGDKNINSALTYLKNNKNTRRFIQDVQDSFGESYRQLLE